MSRPGSRSRFLLRFLSGALAGRLTVALLSLFVFALALKYQWLSNVDLKVYDLGTRMKSTAAYSDVALIAIDHHSLQTCFPRPALPVTRHLAQHSRLIQRLDSAGVALIVLDLLFDQADTVDTDNLRSFADALARSGKVVLACALESHALSDTRGGRVATQTRLAHPPEELREAAVIGLVNVPLDQDGVIRRCYFGRVFQRDYLPSLSSVVAALYTGGKPPVRADRSDFYIDYSLAGAAERIPYEQILDGDNWQESVKGKIAIVGMTGNGPTDTHLTPLSQGGEAGFFKISGVEIQTLAAQTLLMGTSPRPMGRAVAFLLGAAIMVVLGLGVRGLNAVLGMVVTAAALILLVVAGLLAVAGSSMIIPVGAYAVGIVGTGLLALSSRTAFLRNLAGRTQQLLSDITKDMTEAGTIQRKLQPKELPQSDRFDLGAVQITCREVGGDYYDVVDLGNHKLGLLVADVAGKGVPGSLIMANIQGTFRHLVGKSASPAEILAELNKTSVGSTSPEHKFVTLFYGVLDYDSRQLQYCNAGHCYPIVCSAAGKTEMLKESGVPLGLFDGMSWPTGHVPLHEGDVICIYSDGISEAGGDDPEKQFGEDRIAACVSKNCNRPAAEIKDCLLETCQEFVEGASFNDDWTLVVVKLA